MKIDAGRVPKDAAARYIRHSDRPRDFKLRLAFGAFRVVLYAVLGIALEVCLYTAARVGREIPVVEYLFQFDWQVDPALHLDGPWHSPLSTLFGQSSLWMIPVYALPSLTIEVIYRRWLFKRSWWLRASLYGLVIMAFELATGLALKAITGYAIWMYVDRANVMQMTSFFILPIWMAAGLLIELIYRELMDPKVRTVLESELADPAMPPPVDGLQPAALQRARYDSNVRPSGSKPVTPRNETAETTRPWQQVGGMIEGGWSGRAGVCLRVPAGSRARGTPAAHDRPQGSDKTGASKTDCLWDRSLST